jgi:voltage-gated potassium channel
MQPTRRGRRVGLRDVRGRARPRQHYLLRAWNRVRNTLGPALFVALLVLLTLVVGSVITIQIAERDTPGYRSGWSALRWVMVALVSDPPWDVRTMPGRVVSYLVDFLKPSSIALLTAALTSYLFGSLVKRTSGMGRTRMKDHIVICGWSGKGSEIIQEIRGRGDEESHRPVVVLAPIHSIPTRDDLTTFIHGDPTEARDLKRAGIERARTAIVLADNSYPDIDAEDMDSRTLLTTLAIESLNPHCYTCVEVVHSKNREHFRRTKADELVVSAHLTGALLAHSAVTPGLSRVVGDLLTHPEGNEFYWRRVGSEFAGRSFQDALVDLKSRKDCLVIAMARDGTGYVANPPATEELREDDRLLVIARTSDQVE